MNDALPAAANLQLVQSAPQAGEGGLTDDLLEKVPPPSLDPREALKDMRLEETLRKLLEKSFGPFGVTLRDEKARDRYGDIERLYTLAEGKGLQVALLQVPRWITANANNIGSFDEIRTAFENKIVRVISQKEDSGTVGLKRMFKDWQARYAINALLVPWGFLKELKAGKAQLAEILELELQKAAAVAGPAGTPKPLVFVSYSHQDKEWLQQIQLQLTPVLRSDASFRAWDDSQIQPGAKWGDEIERALEAASVAVLLVSKHFLGSSFIHQSELPPLMEAAEKRGLKILWVLVSPCRYETIKLDRFQAAHAIQDSLQALKEKSQAQLDQVLMEIGETIEKAALGQG